MRIRNVTKVIGMSVVAAFGAAGCNGDDSPSVIDGAVADARVETPLDPVVEDATRLIEEGRETFRFDTFGDEAFWGGTLGLHRAIAGEANGGVGPGLSPTAALGLGLKVDVAMVPPDVAAGIQNGTVDLNDPAST